VEENAAGYLGSLHVGNLLLPGFLGIDLTGIHLGIPPHHPGPLSAWRDSMRQLKAPKCHWGNCPQRDKTMFLLGETPEAWLFAHGCGTTRAVVKPSTREQSIQAKYERDIEEIRARQRFWSSRPEYSLPKGER
jgi:hypothetical protein